MMTMSKKQEWVSCPVCGKQLPLNPHPEKPGRLLAVCDCISRGRGSRGVLETDKPPAQPKKDEVKDG